MQCAHAAQPAPSSALQINVKDRVERRIRRQTLAAERCTAARSTYRFLDSRYLCQWVQRVRISRQEKQITKQSDGCATPGSGGSAIWMADTVYQPLAQQIKFTFGRLPRASPSTAAPETALSQPPLMGLIYHFQVYYVKTMLVHVQNVKMMLQSQWNRIICHQMDVKQNDITCNFLKMSQY